MQTSRTWSIWEFRILFFGILFELKQDDDLNWRSAYRRLLAELNVDEVWLRAVWLPVSFQWVIAKLIHTKTWYNIVIGINKLNSPTTLNSNHDVITENFNVRYFLTWFARAERPNRLVADFSDLAFFFRFQRIILGGQMSSVFIWRSYLSRLVFPTNST